MKNIAEERPVVPTDDGKPAVWMPLDVLTAIWRPGSADVRSDDKPWTWDDESDRLWSEQTDRMDALAASLQQDGFREPVMVACDGRCWDGHHRICAALRIGLVDVPAEFVPFTGEWSALATPSTPGAGQGDPS